MPIPPGFTHEEAFERMQSYYTFFILNWKRLPDHLKNGYVFGNGRTASLAVIDQINKSWESYINGLSSTPTLQDSKELALFVRSDKLETFCHDKDYHGISMWDYAKYILDNF